MNETFEYVERRLEPQRKWHNEKATWNKRGFYTAEVATLLAGATIPVVNLWVAKDPFWTGVFSAVPDGVVIVATSVGSSSSFMRTGCNTGRWSKRLNGKRNRNQRAPASTLKRMKMGVIAF